jgi:hypothetical protein
MCPLKQFIVDPIVVKAYAVWDRRRWNLIIRDSDIFNIILEEDELIKGHKYFIDEKTILE